MATINLNVDTFDETIENNAIVILDFWAEWCGPCKMFGPIFEKVSEAHEDIVFAKVNTEEEPQIAAAFGIRSIPTLAIFRDQIPIFAQPGMLPEHVLEDLIGQIRGLDMDEVRAEYEERLAEHQAAQG